MDYCKIAKGGLTYWYNRKETDLKASIIQKKSENLIASNGLSVVNLTDL